MRPLIQYDLDDPPASTSTPPPNMNHNNNIGPHPARPPTKKRKRNPSSNQHTSAPARHLKTPVQHWDDPGSTAVGVIYDEQEASGVAAESVRAVTCTDDVEDALEFGQGAVDEDENADEEEEEEEEESRPLTHGEIWDDSVLVDAWNSAEAEYEAYHGTSKAWKTEPVKRSPLWYNKPYTAPPSKPEPTKRTSRSRHAPEQADDEGGDTAPLDFDTYVPTHDPSLAIPSGSGPAPPATPASFFVPPPSTTMVGRDEAFNNALSAMYWSGYWTAVYHSQSQTNGVNESGPISTSEDGVEDEEDLVPAQR